MKAIAKVISHMEGDIDHIWIVKGKTYDLKPSQYVFIDEQGDKHFIDVEEFDDFFKEED